MTMKEYQVCSVTKKLCHYTEFNKAGWGWSAVDGSKRHSVSKEGKKINHALNNGLRAVVDGRLVSMAHDEHPNKPLWDKIVEQIREENNYKKKLLRADLTKMALLEAYNKLGLKVPDLKKVQLKKTGRSSSNEAMCLDYLGVPKGDKHRQVRIGRYFVDGVVDGVVYEFMGDFWHGNPRLYEAHQKLKGYTAAEKWEKDRKRAETIKSKGYEFVVIWESDWNDFKQGITSELRTEKW